MLLGLHFIRCFSPLRYAIYCGCIVVILSYISMEVLDLDGSNFPRHSIERTAILAETNKITAPDALNFVEAIRNILPSLLDRAHETRTVRLPTLLGFSSFEKVRNRGYRTALPRSSPADSALSASSSAA